MLLFFLTMAAWSLRPAAAITTTHVTALLEHLISTHFIHLATVLVVHDTTLTTRPSDLRLEYLNAVQEGFRNQSQLGNIITLYWFNVGNELGTPDSDNSNGHHAYNIDDNDEGNFSSPATIRMDVVNGEPDNDNNDFQERLLAAVDGTSIEGFITILGDTFRFLQARSYAMQNTQLRLKDKLYLFLCEYENPEEFLSTDILQFYPNHLMVTPAARPDAARPFLIRRVLESDDMLRANRTPAEQTNNTGSTTPGTTTKTAKATLTTESLASWRRWGTSRTTTIRTWWELTKSTLNNFTTADAAGPKSTGGMCRPKSPRLKSPPPRAIPFHLPPTHSDINFELWTQKFVGVAGNLDAVRLNAFLPNETFAIPIALVGGASATTSASNNIKNNNNYKYNSFAGNGELYADKLSNLGGRTFRVGSITYVPYVVTNYVPPGTGNVDPINPNGPQASVQYIGSEAEIVKTFCKIRNCHLRVKPYGPDNWGEIVPENGTATGMLGGVYLHDVEMAIGCVYNWYNDITETSHTIARSAVTILGPAPALYPPWRMHLMPFSATLWQFLCATAALCAFILFLVQWSDHQQAAGFAGGEFSSADAAIRSFLNIFALFIQQPSTTQRLRGFASRFLLASILCATITLENTYSGQLKSLLTVPLFTEAVDTMEKWSRTGWHWAAPSFAWVQTVANSELLKEQILAEKFQKHDYNFLYNASWRSDYGLGVERLMSGAFSFGNFVTADALEMKIIPKDDLFFDWVLAATIRGWPLMAHFNRHVRTCTETGLFMHWERQNVAKYLDDQTQQIMMQLASGHKVKRPPQQLTLANVSGPLFALLFGYSLALVVFVLELIGHRFHMRCKERFFAARVKQMKGRKNHIYLK